MLDVRGVDLFWRSPLRVVSPGNRNWRLEVESKGEMVLLSALLVAAALYPLSHLDFRDIGAVEEVFVNKRSASGGVSPLFPGTRQGVGDSGGYGNSPATHGWCGFPPNPRDGARPTDRFLEDLLAAGLSELVDLKNRILIAGRNPAERGFRRAGSPAAQQKSPVGQPGNELATHHRRRRNLRIVKSITIKIRLSNNKSR
jgi:hypothetical protein